MPPRTMARLAPALLAAALALVAVLLPAGDDGRPGAAEAHNPGSIITGIRITSDPGADESYSAGDTITVRVEFNQWVLITQNATLTIQIGDNARTINLGPQHGRVANPLNTKHLDFNYTVRASDIDTDGISVATTGLTGTISHGHSQSSFPAHGTTTTLPNTLATAQSGHKVLPVNYDADDDGLIAVTSLEQLNAIRWDPDGNGVASDAHSASYAAAFPNAIAGMGCPAYTDDGGTAPTLTSGTAGVRLSRGTLRVTEGAAASVSYNVRLNTNPGANASVAITGSSRVTISDDDTTFASVTATSGITLNFTTANWSADQTVYVKAAADTDGADGIETLYHNPDAVSGDYAAASVSNATLTMTVAENDYLCGGYELGANLNFDANNDGDGSDTGDHYYNGGSGWDPLGVQYAADFQGNGHTIANLYINRATVDSGVGLFAAFDGNLSGVGLVNVDVTGGRYTGALFGTGSANTDVTASYSTGTVSGSQIAGGLIGHYAGNISASYSGASVSASSSSNGNAGGLVGFARGGAITTSYATGSVSSARIAGGLVGETAGEVTASYATGSVTRTGSVGNHGGGLVGTTTSTVRASYATGAVSGFTTNAGLIGYISSGGTAPDSYWDSTTSGIADDNDNDAPEGKSTADLQSPTGPTGIYANWDDLTIDEEGTNDDDPWHFGGSSAYPILAWEGLAQVNQGRDYDDDDDGLIDIRTLAQLDAMRWDREGSGASDDTDDAKDYAMAFPGAPARLGCQAADHDNDANTPEVPTCTGYELRANLDFDANGDGDGSDAGDHYYNGGRGWDPIGTGTLVFGAPFRGNGHTISNLYINRPTEIGVGLFHTIGGDRASISGVGLVNVNVTGSSRVGGLAGAGIFGSLSAVYSTGSVTGGAIVGGLVGQATGTKVLASYSLASVRATAVALPRDGAGGLVGVFNNATAVASFARGSVTRSSGGSNLGSGGGLFGTANGSTVRASYATGRVSGFANNGGITGSSAGGTYEDVYWDTARTGIADDGDAAAPEGKSSAELTGPKSAAGIYANWDDLTVDDTGTNDDDPWYFGRGLEYPILAWGANGWGTLPFAANQGQDYDRDGDGLIRIETLEQLNAIRWDLDGNGQVADANRDALRALYPGAPPGLGCPLTDHDNDANTPNVPTCTGYELRANLDFDANNDGDGADAGDHYNNGGVGWTPIGNTATYTGDFDGNGHTISHLYINRSDTSSGLALFRRASGSISGVGMVNVSVSGLFSAGALVGEIASGGSVRGSYSTGAVSGGSNVGGLVAQTYGAIAASYSRAAVSNDSAGADPSTRVGGLVGVIENGGTTTASYATGSVSRTTGTGGSGGGLAGLVNGGTVRASYALGAVTGFTSNGGLSGSSMASPTYEYSYWDTLTTGIVDDNDNAAPEGKLTFELREPAAYGSASDTPPSLYASWDVNVDGVSGGDDPWDFGTPTQWPALKYDGLDTASQFAAQPTVSADKTLSALSAAPATLTPAFAAATRDYEVAIADRKATLAVTVAATATAAASGATVAITPADGDAGTDGHQVTLGSGTYAITVKVTAQDGGSQNYTVSVAKYDYDADDDGLIDITELAQLDAIRYDLNGDGAVDSSSNQTAYDGVFPNPAPGLGCRLTDHDNDAGTPMQATCGGYELDVDLDFDTDGDGRITVADGDISYGAGADAGKGWDPLGSNTTPYTGDFDGNGKVIANLMLDDRGSYAGLFGATGSGAHLTKVGLVDAQISNDSSFFTGALAGGNSGQITASYLVGGRVSAATYAGGLVGINHGTITAAYARTAVECTALGAAYGGGLAGSNNAGATIAASYASATVTGACDNLGGLAGSNNGTITASYWDTAVSGIADDADADAPEGKTVAELRTPTSASGIYADWDDLDLTDDGVSNATDDPWDFGSGRQYPVLAFGGQDPADQRGDYDLDNDGLIEIYDLQHLNALRYDLGGDGVTATTDAGDYTAAFLASEAGMGCPAYQDDGGTAPTVSGAAVRLSRGSLRVTEGGAAGSYGVRLNQVPTATVTLTITAASGATISGSETGTYGATLTLTFTTSDWDTDQTVYVKAAADGDGDNENVTVTHAGAGVGYQTLAVTTAESSLVCAGYELLTGLDFDTDGSGSVGAGDAYPNWTPIGDSANAYTAAFRGHNLAIANLTINSAASRVGLFGRATGTLTGAALRDVSVQATVAASGAVGALVGESAGIVRGCSATGVVNASGAGSGGNYVGGLVGQLNAGTIEASYALVAVSSAAASSPTGGLAGNASGTGNAIRASYAGGAVAAGGANSNAGGLVGSAANSVITASYSYGTVTASGSGGTAGGFAGATTSATISDSYWDTDSSDIADDADSTAPEGRTTSQLQTPTDYGAGQALYANWNINVDGVDGNDDPWQFGTAYHYPALHYGAMSVPAQRKDYDADGDGLIDITTLAQLNAIRYDLDGNGAPAADNQADYYSVFRNYTTSLGCPSGGCAGYELLNDLNFDTDGDGDVDASDPGSYANWTPIGAYSTSDDSIAYRANFQGNGHTIANLTINSATVSVGLFGAVRYGEITGVGLPGVSVTATGTVAIAGALVGYLGGQPNPQGEGKVISGWATGSVQSTGAGATLKAVGGLVGALEDEDNAVTASYAGVSVAANAAGTRAHVGGLVGSGYGSVTASYATGSVTGGTGSNSHTGGLMGYMQRGAALTASYAAGPVATVTGANTGGLYGGGSMPTITDSYWDTGTSGQSTSPGGVGKTASELQSVITATGIYEDWDDLDLTYDETANAVDDPWDFGTDMQYPVVTYGYNAAGIARQKTRQNASLSALSSSVGALSPGFAAGTLAYTLTVPPATTTTTLTATASLATDGAAVTLTTETATASISGNVVTLATGTGDTVVTVTATAPNGVNKRVYTLTISKGPRAFLTGPTAAVAEGGSAEFTVTVSGVTTSAVTVTYDVAAASANGAAASDLGNSDNTAALAAFPTGQTATVPAGRDRTATISIPIYNDTDPEGAEGFTLTLTGASGGTTQFINTPAAATIALSDPALQFSNAGGTTITTLSVGEDTDTTTYLVALAARPDNGVRVTITPAAGNGVTVQTTGSSFTASATLDFTTGNWNTGQVVTVQTEDDSDSSNETVAIAHAATDLTTNQISGYDGVTKSLSVTIVDNDAPGITLSATMLTVVEENSTGVDYTVELATEPTADVSVTVTASAGLTIDGPDAATAFTGSETLTFLTSNWSTTQTISVQAAADDDLADGNGTISHAAADATPGTASGYASISASLPVVISDNDTPSIVLSETGTLSVDEGDSDGATYTVELSHRPDAGVTITVTSSTSDDVTIDGPDADTTFSDSEELEFTAGNWDTAQTVTVKAGMDADLADDTGLTLAHAAADTTVGTDSLFSSAATVNLSVTATDTTTPSIVLTRSGSSNAITTLAVAEEGADVTYDVALSHQPLAGVTVTVASGDSTAVTLEGPGDADTTFTGSETVVFTTQNWNTARTVSVRGVNDGDSVHESVTLTHRAADTTVGSASGYGSISRNLTVNVTDNDTPSLVVSESSLTLTEATAGNGHQDDFTVRLNTLPTGSPARVTVDIASNNDDVGLRVGSSGNYGSSVSLTFDATGTNIWSTARTVQVQAADDADGEDDAASLTFSISGGNYGSVTHAALPVTVTDNDTKGITFDPTRLTGANAVGEGTDTGSYTVKLDTQPTSTVTVSVSSNNSDVTIRRGSSGSFGSSASLSFSTTNWNSAQTVQVKADEDNDSTNDTATLTHTGSGGGYGDGATGPLTDITGTLTVTVTDDDTPGINLSRTALTITEAAARQTYTVRLNTQPSAAVTVAVSKNNPDVKISATDSSSSYGDDVSLSFSVTNWNTAQTVYVRANDDADGEGDVDTLTHDASGGDYGTVSDATLALTITDNDAKAILLNPAGLSSVNEGTSNRTYTVRLATQPTATMTVAVSSDNAAVRVQSGGGSFGSSTNLTFTASTYATAQTVTVEAPEDDNSVSENVTISHVGNGGGYGDGGGPNADITKDLSVSVADDDTPSLRVAPGSLTLDENTTGSFTVRLNTQPTGSPAMVTVGIASSNDDVRLRVGGSGNYTASVSLTFNATGGSLWSSDQTVNVQAGQDLDGDNDTASLSFNISGSDYNSVTRSAFTVTVTDDDPKGISLSETGSLAVSEGAAAASYTVVLDTQPSDTARVAVSSSDPSRVSVSRRSGGGFGSRITLSFNASNYGAAQTVYARGNADDDTVSETGISLAHTASGGGYAGIAASLSVALTDTSTPGLVINPSPLDIKESADRDYAVRLTTQPASAVTVTIRRDAGSAGIGFDANGDGTFATAGSESLTFNSGNWNAPQAVKVRAPADVSADTTATLSHAASGADYGSVSGNLTVNVRDNRPPVAEAGADQQAYSGQTITLAGSATDPDDAVSTLSYSWRQSGGAPEVTLSGANTARPRFTVPTTLTADTTVEFELTVTDPSGRTDTDTVRATLLAARPNELVSLQVSDRAGNRPLTPPFASIRRSFEASVGAYATTARIILTPADDAATVSLAGRLVPPDAAGVRAATVHLAEGGNRYTIVVTPAPVAPGSNDTPLPPVIYLLNIRRQPVPRLAFSPARIVMDEGDSATYTVNLDTRWLGSAVMVAIASDNPAVTVSPASVRFTPTNWAPRTVTVTAAQDDDGADDTASLNHRASGGHFDNVYGRVRVEIADDDGDGTVTPTPTPEPGTTPTPTPTSTPEPTPTPTPPPGPPTVSETNMAEALLDGHTVTIIREAGSLWGVSIALPAALTRDLAITIAPLSDDVPRASDRFGLGMTDAAQQSGARLTVTGAPAGGLEMCLPLSEQLVSEAGDRPLTLVRYDDAGAGQWQRVAGAAQREMTVCAAGVPGGTYAAAYIITPPLGPASELTVSVGDTPGTLTLRWTPGAQATMHWVAGIKQSDWDANDFSSLIWTAASASNTHTLSGLASGAEYVFTIAAGRRVDGIWEWSDWTTLARGTPH